MGERHRLLIFPRPDRPLPHPKDWLPLLATVLAAVLVAAALVVVRPWQADPDCHGEGTWLAGTRCVGLSEGAYAFGIDDFAPIMAAIDRQNGEATRNCPGPAVTVGVLLTMTDPFAGGRPLHELEGMAAGQRAANDVGCVHPVRLIVGQLGDYDGNGDPAGVARRLAARGDVVAVAGVGLSNQATVDVVNTLADKKIPMVSDVVTAEGFDRQGSRADRPDFASCDRGATYSQGMGTDYYYRLAHRVFPQIQALHGSVGPRPDYVMVPTDRTDPYTCTALPLLHREFGDVTGNDIVDVKFDTTDPVTVDQTARRVCADPKEVTVAYLARGRDLARFVVRLDELYANGQCAAKPVDIVSVSDGDRLRHPELDPGREDLRRRALTSPSFTSGRIRLVYSLLAGAERGPEDPNTIRYRQAFTGAGFDPEHLPDNWAVNGYDAVLTIATAVNRLPAGQPVERTSVNSVIGGFSAPAQAVPGAGGPIMFDNGGNRSGQPPAVVRLCPIDARPDQPLPVPATVPSRPGQTYPDCPR
ncbi:ABC transporter substrate-binding protein [Nocardia blacklockiae]|uniref:ABC transporter substrate-binding protein n=1 Tax=Nocardia blacklockiae TaxID=480036 RepID=UPI00189617B1|nr:ABC transporter substrate-binding protein [Nocardia blacklockiae]MBF6175149.1 ABC transporter substrate-binding protein [Nocardia blacklockiae]